MSVLFLGQNVPCGDDLSFKLKVGGTGSIVDIHINIILTAVFDNKSIWDYQGCLSLKIQPTICQFELTSDRNQATKH